MRSALAVLGMLAGCGSPTACEEFDQKLVSACDQPVPDKIDECDEDTQAACISQCGLNADCDVLLGTGDIDDPDYAERAAFFAVCVESC